VAEQTLANIFNECIEQLAAGQSVDACLRLYPNDAARLRPMLETGQLVGRMSYPLVEVTAAQEQVWSRIERAYNPPQPVRRMRFPRQSLWLAAVLAALLILAGVMAAAQNSAPGDPLYGVKVFIESILGGETVPTTLPTSTPTQTLAPTETAAPTLTAQSIVTPTATATASETPAEATAEVTEDVTAVIEGPVEAINGNVITIYGIEITIDPDDPLLIVIRIDDVIRVEGDFSGASVVLADVTAVGSNDEVFVNDSGEVWRDNGSCDNPPPDWAPAHGWRRRCQGGAGNGEGAGVGNGQGNGNANGNANGSSNGMGMGSGS
jgi:hypothetical protein